MEDANWYPIEQVVEASASRLREERKNLVEEMNRAMKIGWRTSMISS